MSTFVNTFPGKNLLFPTFSLEFSLIFFLILPLQFSAPDALLSLPFSVISGPHHL